MLVQEGADSSLLAMSPGHLASVSQSVHPRYQPMTSSLSSHVADRSETAGSWAGCGIGYGS